MCTPGITICTQRLRSQRGYNLNEEVLDFVYLMILIIVFIWEDLYMAQVWMLEGYVGLETDVLDFEECFLICT